MLPSFLTLPVSLILAGGALYCFVKAVLGPSWVARLNNGIHALMALGMLGMVWHHVELPVLPQLLLFGMASFWFLLQAVSKKEFKLACHTQADRINCIYHAAMLAAMVFMLNLPHSAVPLEPPISAAQNTGHASHTGHAWPSAASLAVGARDLWIQPATQVLAVLFTVAVLAWLARTGLAAAGLLGSHEPGTNRPTRRREVLLNSTFETGAALSMALMFITASLQS